MAAQNATQQSARYSKHQGKSDFCRWTMAYDLRQIADMSHTKHLSKYVTCNRINFASIGQQHVISSANVWVCVCVRLLQGETTQWQAWQAWQEIKAMEWCEAQRKHYERRFEIENYGAIFCWCSNAWENAEMLLLVLVV